jgi:VWFA-related protein
MVLIKLFRTLLVVALLLSIAFVFQHGGKAISTAPAALAQDGSRDDTEDIQGQTAISVAVDLVSLQALVTDKKGNVILGLKPENFTLYEDNVKQEISHFSTVEANITVVMLVEYSRQVQYFIRDVWNSMYAFAETLRKDDWVAVVGYDMKPTILCDFTQDRTEVYDALRRFTIPVFDDSNLSDALIDSLDRIEEIDGKVAILLISTGLDTFSRHTYEEALDKCKQSDASVFAVSLGQNFRLRAEAAGLISSLSNIELLMADNRLRSFSDFTGGFAYFPRFETELPSIFKNISQLLRSQYSIAYASTNTKTDRKFRKIRLEVNADVTDVEGKPIKFKVYTRKGYLPREF